MSNYFIGDLVSRMNVASRAHLKSVCVKNTFVSVGILQILERYGLILYFKVLDADNLMVFLKYYQNRSVFFCMEIVSRPSKRVYWTLPVISNNFSNYGFSGFFIISSSAGFVTSNDSVLGGCAGGEVLIKVYV
jgi:ribosomal protein S8